MAATNRAIDNRPERSTDAYHVGSDLPFYAMLAILGGTYVVLLIGLLVSDLTYVVTSKSNEIQRLSLTGAPQGGEFTLSFLPPHTDPHATTAETTDLIPYDATPADVQRALERLASIADSTRIVNGLDQARTTFDVQDATVFKRPPFEIRIDGEDIQVLSISGNTLTVRRGTNGTAAAKHFDGALISRDVAVSGHRLPSAFVEIEFRGAYAYTDIPPLTADASRLTGQGDQFVAVTTQLDAALPQGLEWCRAAVRPAFPLITVLRKPEIRYSIKLTLISCLFTAILSLFVAVPIGYVLSRYRFPGRNLLDALLDIPIVLPPLVVGLCLLILFQFWPFRSIAPYVIFQIPAVILAQFMVAAAFAVRIMRSSFDQIDTRLEKVALTLGCTQAQAFGMVVLPQCRQGMLTAGTLAWARSLGEFGPLLIFAGATRNKTEVLSTSVFLELSIGNLEAAAAVSLVMIVAAVVVLVIARLWGSRSLSL